MITAEQRTARMKYVGSSDCAAILNLDPYRSSADVFLEKTGRVNDFEGNAATDRGTLLEPAILDWAESQIGIAFERNVMRVHANELLAANFDGINHDDGEPFVVEAKSTVDDSEWGSPGTDEIPKRVLCQTHHQFIVAGEKYRHAFVPVLMPQFKKFDFRMYSVERNDELCEMIAEQEIEFMEKYVKADRQPDDFRPSLEVLKRMRREPNKVISIPNIDIVKRWMEERDERLAAEKREEAAAAAVLAALGDAECAILPNGSQVSYLETHRKGYSVKPTSFRVLRLKNA